MQNVPETIPAVMKRPELQADYSHYVTSTFRMLGMLLSLPLYAFITKGFEMKQF
jgi:hypothetical protein